MTAVHVALLSVELELPTCRTLKDKRSVIRSLLAALRRELTCAVAEVDRLDDPRRSVIACAVVSNDPRQAQRVVQKIPSWIERHRPDLVVIDCAVDLR